MFIKGTGLDQKTKKLYINFNDRLSMKKDNRFTLRNIDTFHGAKKKTIVQHFDAITTYEWETMTKDILELCLRNQNDPIPAKLNYIGLPRHERGLYSIHRFIHSIIE